MVVPLPNRTSWGVDGGGGGGQEIIIFREENTAGNRGTCR